MFVESVDVDATSQSLSVARAVDMGRPLDATSVVALQRLHGNAFVQRLIADPTSAEEATAPIRANTEGTLAAAYGDSDALVPVALCRTQGA